MELVIDRLTKQYQNKIAVDRVSLRLEKGVYGLLGSNGAGKTTLMRMICGILKPTGGTVTFNGMDVSREEYRAVLGYLPQDFGYYPDFTGMDFLLYMACLKGISKAEAKKRAVELLELVGLKGMGKKRSRCRAQECQQDGASVLTLQGPAVTTHSSGGQTPPSPPCPQSLT